MTKIKSGFFVTFVTLYVLNIRLIYSQRYSPYRDLREHRNWPLLDHGTFCGRVIKSGRRILGGEDAAFNEFPWLVSPMIIGSTPQSDPSEPPILEVQLCGGSVINDRYVLTAAHCCIQADKKAVNSIYYVRLNGDGGYNIVPVTLPVEEVTIHEQYRADISQNDICLVRLQNPLEFTETFQPICLPVEPEWKYKNLSGLNMTVAGWGFKYYESTMNFKMADRLQKMEVSVTPPRTCVWQWRNAWPPAVIDPVSQVCAGTRYKDACQGDSGGPLMFRNSLNIPRQYFLIGLVSFGSKCKLDKTPLPGVYMKVSYYMPWILDNIYE